MTLLLRGRGQPRQSWSKRKAAHSSAVLSPEEEQERGSTSWDANAGSLTLRRGPAQRKQQLEEKVGVLLLNLGGPETLDDVQPFLYNLFNDDSIIRLPPQGELL